MYGISYLYGATPWLCIILGAGVVYLIYTLSPNIEAFDVIDDGTKLMPILDLYFVEYTVNEILGCLCDLFSNFFALN